MRNLFASAADSRVPTGFPAVQRCSKRVAWRDRDAASCVRAGIVEGMIDNRPPSWSHRDPFRFLRAAQVELANIVASEAASLVRLELVLDDKQVSGGIGAARGDNLVMSPRRENNRVDAHVSRVKIPNNTDSVRLPPGDFPSGARSP